MGRYQGTVVVCLTTGILEAVSVKSKCSICLPRKSSLICMGVYPVSDNIGCPGNTHQEIIIKDIQYHAELVSFDLIGQ